MSNDNFSSAMASVVPAYLEKRRALKRNITPYFLVTIIAALTIFDFGVGQDIVAFNSLSFFGDGLIINSPRVVVFFCLVILIWVLFVRFGVLYYQMIEFSNDLVNRVNKLGTVPEKELYLHVAKDAYIVDAILIHYHQLGHSKKIWIHKIIAYFVILAFVTWIAAGQYLTIIAASSVDSMFGVLLLIFYSIYYALFIVKLINTNVEYESGVEVGDQSKSKVWKIALVALFVTTSTISTILNGAGWVQFRATRSEGVSEFNNKICYEKFSIFSAERPTFGDCPIPEEHTKRDDINLPDADGR